MIFCINTILSICIRSIIIKRQHLRQRFSILFLQSDIYSLQFIFFNFAPPWRKVDQINDSSWRIHWRALLPYTSCRIIFNYQCTIKRIFPFYIYLDLIYLNVRFFNIFFKEINSSIFYFIFLFFYVILAIYHIINRCSKRRCWLRLS